MLIMSPLNEGGRDKKEKANKEEADDQSPVET